MPFDLHSELTHFHQIVMELSGPLLEWIDAVPALQVLQPYRDSLPYVAAGLGLLLLLVLVRALRRTSRRKKASNNKKEGFRTKTAPASAIGKTPIQGRAIDIAPDFDPISSFPASPFVPRDFSAAPLETAPEPAPAPQEAVPQRPVAPAQNVEAAFSAPPRPSSAFQPAAGAPIAAPDPSIALSDAAIPMSAAPVAPGAVPAAAPAPAPAVRPEVPEPPGPAPAPSRVTPPNADFRKIYIVMYIDRELTTNFSALRDNVNGRLARKDPTEPLMPAGSGSSEDNIFAHLALAALDDLHSKEARLETGALSPHGQELCTVYEYALQHLRESGRLAEEPAQSLLRETLQKMG